MGTAPGWGAGGPFWVFEERGCVRVAWEGVGWMKGVGAGTAGAPGRAAGYADAAVGLEAAVVVVAAFAAGSGALGCCCCCSAEVCGVAPCGLTGAIGSSM